jgi:hypothetical protein
VIDSGLLKSRGYLLPMLIGLLLLVVNLSFPQANRDPCPLIPDQDYLLSHTVSVNSPETCITHSPHAKRMDLDNVWPNSTMAV